MPPPIPFPFPFGMRIGTDICHIPRIVQSFYSKTWPRFVRRILTEEELANARSAVTELLDEHEGIVAARQQPKGPYEGRGPNADPKKLDLAATFLAGRFAAKEAVIKAHPHIPGLSFRSIVIMSMQGAARTLDPRAESCPPVALLKTRELLGAGARDQTALLSISHDKDYATAVCIGFDQRMVDWGGAWTEQDSEISEALGASKTSEASESPRIPEDKNGEKSDEDEQAR
ncbi:Holo-[acyl-carrier-protein] synthase [Madurella mycetomatis]|uniref:Holo-[acyl-carrier-protein] synthase n=1 Tax=Madurella mycetomatis TaxID=100816 RepID=A0A175W4Z7_9PEZI|nr:Holo-[acyl-carrier-protein] synthase [Madurella mycetomatis]